MLDVPIPTTPSYTTPDDVAEMRREPKYTDTEPGAETGRRWSRAFVTKRILAWEDHIDRETKHAWRARRITDFMDDLKIGAMKNSNRWDSSARMFDNWWVIPFPHRSIRPLVVGTNKIELWNGGAWTDYVATGMENRGGGTHWLDYDRGNVFVRHGLVSLTDYRVRLTLDYGETSVPGPISIAATYLTAADLEISQPGRTPEGQADKIRSSSRYDLWTTKAKEVIDRFREVQVV